MSVRKAFKDIDSSLFGKEEKELERREAEGIINEYPVNVSLVRYIRSDGSNDGYVSVHIYDKAKEKIIGSDLQPFRSIADAEEHFNALILKYELKERESKEAKSE